MHLIIMLNVDLGTKVNNFIRESCTKRHLQSRKVICCKAEYYERPDENIML